MYLGTWIDIGGGLVRAYVQIDNNTPAFVGGGIRFERVTTRPGGRVCADFDLAAGMHTLVGHFCAVVRESYY